ncbi:hypothetical protein MKL09_25255 [Methylobacterium sp. J-048]|uniref:hypothetical protein n=1 Tax=Methylobacterium sp. J-048 TaxID=2836635 RepID=UPI001FBB0447|nr:hypothetical protein [Methylobacterium sp. J-048]MCJ2059825.1 hypothetical protein [Methylobacterium sp. J-048]
MRIPSRSTARESIGIEALMVRAYREKKIDRLGVDTRRMLGIRGPMAPGSNALARGERVDTSGWGASAASQAREVLAMLYGAGDALLTAHDLVLSLDDYFCEDHNGEDLAFSLWTREGALEAGHFIAEEERGGTAFIQAAKVTRELGPDGETVRVAPIEDAPLRRLSKIVVAPLIVVAGRSDMPPYVSPIEIDRVRAVWCRRTRRRIGTRTEYITPLDVVVQERAAYAAWHHALTALAEQLADLPGLAIAPPCLPARPWEAEAVAA